MLVADARRSTMQDVEHQTETDQLTQLPQVLSEASMDQLEGAIGSGAARIAGLQCRWLLAVAEYVRRGGPGRWETSPSQWLSWRCGVDAVTAREHLRVGEALSSFPVIRAAFASGQLSYSKVRAITRVATPGNEEGWVNTALALPADKLVGLTRQYRQIDRNREKAIDQLRYLSYRWDQNGMLVGSFALAPDEGMQFIAAIEAASLSGDQPVDSADAPAAQPVDSADAPAAQPARDIQPTGLAATPVDALMRLSGSTDPASVEVTLHVSAGQLGSAAPDRRDISTGSQVPAAIGPAAAQRLACDPIVTAILSGRDGTTLDVGRRQRLVTSRLKRAVIERDGGQCVYPGCSHRRWVQVHHIVHWEDGGKTDLSNLALLCDRHHRRLHAGAFTMELVGSTPQFYSPIGDRIPSACSMQDLPSPDGSRLARAMDTAGWSLGPIQGNWDGERLDRVDVVNTLYGAA